MDVCVCVCVNLAAHPQPLSSTLIHARTEAAHETEGDSEEEQEKKKEQTGHVSHMLRMKMRGSFAEMYSCFAEIQGSFPEI